MQPSKLLIDQKKLFESTAIQCSRIVTKKYSTSFSLGISLIDKQHRDAIYAIYGYVRYADEIVDTFYDQDKATLLNEFRLETYKAIERGISMNPIISSFQKVVRQYGIDVALIDAFLNSMEMDLTGNTYNDTSYNEYIYGSAEVVGLMCLLVFCSGDKTEYERLKAAARSLGAAFQKVNFLRDMKDDFDERGRIYFPGINFANFTTADKALIEAEIEKDFADALIGIKQLPIACRKGVYLAYRYYTKLFKKIKKKEPKVIKTERVRINNFIKLVILLKSDARYRLNML
ncbi:MAG: phytoene/squalene synthase family protein [Sphingobacteriales bacterium JAD_PAG50586_3]|nr:MAG: phytoene/squalene synthase family protein [Sphingobacteriales bacterium JAD_PAG50586_3]